MFGEGHSLDHGLGFVDGFVELGLRHGVGDPAAAGLDVGFAILEHRGANGDAAVEVAVKAEVANGAAIGAASGLLEFADDLHGAYATDHQTQCHY